MSDLIKNPDLLKESNRDFDFFNFDKYARNLHNNLKSSSIPTVTTLVGEYGTGKSVLLNEVKKLTDESKAKDKPKWVFFECWQYPDKKDLWEALILDLVEQIGGEKKRDKMLSSYSDIESWRDWFSRYLNKTGAAMAVIVATAFLVWLITDDDTRSFLIPVATSLIVVLVASIELLTRPESKSAVSRLSDYKSELEKTLLSHTGPLYIVLEDVDRAGELGRRFFETVSHFVKEKKFEKKNIKVIVPVADIDSSDRKSLHDSIDKASDNILYFRPAFNCENFITEVFSDEFLSESTKQLLVSTINPLVGRKINIRKLKHLLRNSIVKHRRLLSKDFASRLEICIAVEFSKYMNASYSSTTTLYSQAANNYEHKPLFEWASQNKLINRDPDEPETIEVRPKDHFKKSEDIFPGVSYEDMGTNMSTGSKKIVNRVYLISRAYFDDL